MVLNMEQEKTAETAKEVASQAVPGTTVDLAVAGINVDDGSVAQFGTDANTLMQKEAEVPSPPNGVDKKEASLGLPEAERGKSMLDTVIDGEVNNEPSKYSAFDYHGGRELSEESLQSLSKLGASTGLDQKNMQEFVSWYVGESKKASSAYEKVVDSWYEQTQKEFGGASRPRNDTLVKNGWSVVGSDALRKVLTDVRINFHPEIMRMLIKVGEKFSEDSFSVSHVASASRQTKSTPDILYSNTPSPKGASSYERVNYGID